MTWCYTLGSKPRKPHDNALALVIGVLKMVQVKEGEVKLIEDKHENISYPEISSCLTVTCLLSNDSRIAAHLVQKPTKDMISAADFIETIDSLRKTHSVKKILIAGDAVLTPDLVQSERVDSKGRIIPKESLTLNLDEEKEAWGTKHFGALNNAEGATNIGFMLGVYFKCQEIYAHDGSITGDLAVDPDFNLTNGSKVIPLGQNIFDASLLAIEDLEDAPEFEYDTSKREKFRPA